MKIVFEVKGFSCDLALHPISPQTAKSMQKQATNVYTEKQLHWWRRGATRTFGMRIDETARIRLFVDHEEQQFNAVLLFRNVHSLKSRMYLSSKAHHLALLGYDDEACTFRWIWNDIQDFSPEKFNFAVTKWDHILNKQGYRVLDIVTYDGQLADEDEWLNPSGFTLMEPKIINLDDVRNDLKAKLEELDA